MDRGIDYSELIQFLSVCDVPHIILMEATGRRIFEEIGKYYPAFNGTERIKLVYHLDGAVALAKKICRQGHCCVMSPAAILLGRCFVIRIYISNTVFQWNWGFYVSVYSFWSGWHIDGPEGGHYKMRTICAAVFWYWGGHRESGGFHRSAASGIIPEILSVGWCPGTYGP